MKPWIPILTVAGVTIRESFSRKQYAVLVVLMALAYVVCHRLQFLGVQSDSRFALHVPLLGIPLLGGILGVLAGARQIPYEIRNRTLYPLLAKPVSRRQVVLGKWLGVVALVGATQWILGAVMALALHGSQIHIGTTYWQQMVLFTFQMMIVVALALFLSVVVNYDAAVVLGLVLFLGLSGGTFTELEVQAWARQLEGGARLWTLLPTYLLPRLDLFVNPMTQIVLFDWPARPWATLLPLLGYGAGWSAIFLALGAWAFQRRDL